MEREGFTPAWFNDRGNRFMIREDASLYYRQPGRSDINIVLYGAYFVSPDWLFNHT